MVIPDKSGWLINEVGAQSMLEMLKIIIADESYRNTQINSGNWPKPF